MGNQQLIKKKLTLILISNRIEFATRQLEFLKLNMFYQYVDILISYSGNQEKFKIDSLNSTMKIKFYDENINVWEKIKDSVKYVTTPYVMLLADDDFILIDNLKKIIENLNDDYPVNGFKSIEFKQKNNKIIWHYNKSYKNYFYSIMKIEEFKYRIQNTSEENINTMNELSYLKNIDKSFYEHNIICYVRENHKDRLSNIDNPNIVIKSNFFVSPLTDLFKLVNSDLCLYYYGIDKDTRLQLNKIDEFLEYWTNKVK